MAGFVYLIKLDRPLGTPKHCARYYLGSTSDLNRRMQQHRAGRGAAMLRAANEKGIPYRVCRLWSVPTLAEARLLELKLKARKNHALLLKRN